jgi:hypothetical protein
MLCYKEVRLLGGRPNAGKRVHWFIQGSCLVGELAKVLAQNGINIGQNRLFEWLRRNGYLGTCGERRNIPM